MADRLIRFPANGIGQPAVHDQRTPLPQFADRPRNLAIAQFDDRHLATDFVHDHIAIVERRGVVGAEMEGESLIVVHALVQLSQLHDTVGAIHILPFDLPDLDFRWSPQVVRHPRCGVVPVARGPG